MLGLIDTEHGSSRKYGNLFNFEVLELSKFDRANTTTRLKTICSKGAT
jgi:hypothetical protein